MKAEEIPYGARLIRVLKDLIEKEASGLSRISASASLRDHSGVYDLKILENCVHLKIHPSLEQKADQIATILIAELTNKHVLVSPLVTVEGMMIAPSGTEISNLILEKARNFRTLHELREPIQVRLQVR